MFVQMTITSPELNLDLVDGGQTTLVIDFYLTNYIRLNWIDEPWESGRTYVANDALKHGKISYIALRLTEEEPFPLADDWSILCIDGENGETFIPTIGPEGNWYVNGVDTGKPSRGQAGTTYIPTIGVDGNWYINDVDTGKPSRGIPGREVEMAINQDTLLQYRLTGGNWITLIDTTTLIGETGKNVEFAKSSTHIVWRVVGDTNWINLVALSELKGEPGVDAYTIAQNGGYTGTLADFTAFLNGSYEPKNTNIQSHIGDGSIHHTTEALDELYSPISHNHNSDYEPKNSNIQAHISSTSNPHSVTKSQVGLPNVDNTSDANKPLSNAEINALSGKVDKETGKGLSQENYTTAEKSKLASLEPSLWLGEYPNLAALQTAHPTGVSGNSAYVDLGVGVPVATYVWDVTDNAWALQQGTTTAETAASIKEKYESNPDTNAYTDAEKTKLGGISTGADVTKDVLSNATTNNTIDDSDSFNFIKLIVGVPTLVKSTYAYLKSYLKTYFDTLYSAVNHNHDLTYSATNHNHDLTYEAKDSNIQSHIGDNSIHHTLEQIDRFAVTNVNDTAGRWTALIPSITELYNGLKITIKISKTYDGTYNTLNINGLGEQLVWFRVGARLTSHVAQNNIITLIYDSNAGSYSTFNGGWVLDFSYYDTGDTSLAISSFQPLAGETIYSGKLCSIATDDKIYPFTSEGNVGTTKTISTKSFKLPINILYNSGTDGVGSRVLYLYPIIYHTNLLYTLNQTFAAYADIYLVGIPNWDNNSFVLDNSSYTAFATGILPTTEDGKIYIYLGKTSTSGDIMHQWDYHPIYYYKDGALRLFGNDKWSIDNKQPINLKFSNTQVLTGVFVSDTTYATYGYKADIALTGVTATMVAEVIYGHAEAISGNYSPICVTGAGIVTIYSKVNTTITIPTILINK